MLLKLITQKRIAVIKSKRKFNKELIIINAEMCKNSFTSLFLKKEASRSELVSRG